MSPDDERAGLTPGHVFHPTDFSASSEIAFVHALKLALAARSRFTVFHVAPRQEGVDRAEFPGITETLVRWKAVPADADDLTVENLGIKPVQATARGSDPVDSTLFYLERDPADFLVLATHGHRGLPRWLHKSVAEPIANNTRARTLIIPWESNGFISRDTGDVSLARILIPIAREPDPRSAVETAAGLARLLGCEDVTFSLLHVGDHHIAIEGIEGPGWTWTNIVESGSAVDTIAAVAARDAMDLIVLATAGQHGALDALRGSTTDQIVRAAPGPVLAVPVDFYAKV